MIPATVSDEWMCETPGAFSRCEGLPEDKLYFACPGCGQFGGIRVGNPKPPETPSWLIVSGDKKDPTTLTLSPSIHCISCCGWHGYLQSGIFTSC